MSVNLLPDERLKRFEQKSQKRMAIISMIAVVAVCAALLVLGVVVVSAQGLGISALTKSIYEKNENIKSIPNVDDILLTQQRLSVLSGLYAQRVKLSAFFGVIQSIAPQDISIRSLALGDGNVITISGTAKDYLTASKLAKAMEQSGAPSIDGKQVKPYFSNVVLSGLTADQTTGRVSFTISAVASSGVINGQE